jgi:hypothetical protein
MRKPSRSYSRTAAALLVITSSVILVAPASTHRTTARSISARPTPTPR